MDTDKDIFTMMDLELKLLYKDIRVNSEILREKYKNGKMNLASLNLEYLPMGSLIALNPEQLELGNNKLSEIPGNFGKLTNLKSLSLVQNDLSDLPDNFNELVNLEALYLSSNQFTTVPCILKLLVNLKKIQFTNNNIEIFEFNFPKTLEVLIASHCNISILKLGNCQLKNFKSMGLSYNRITKLPEIENKVSFENISISNNQLKEFPYSWHSDSIKTLQLEKNELEQFDFTGLNGIVELRLGENMVTKLVGVLDMPYINTMSIGGNPIEKLPDLSGIKNIKTFNMGGTLISSFPESFAYLENLEYLDISNNLELKTIPDFFINLKKLKRLSIRRSKRKYGRICIPIHVVESLNKIRCSIDGHQGKVHIRVSESCEKDDFGKSLTDVFPEYRQKGSF